MKMAQIPQNELLESITELTKGELNLLLYYYTLNDGWVFDDNTTMKKIGAKTLRNVKDYRRGLIQKGYLLIQRGETDVYFIGKKSVSEFKKSGPEESTEEDNIAKEPIVVNSNHKNKKE